MELYQVRGQDVATYHMVSHYARGHRDLFEGVSNGSHVVGDQRQDGTRSCVFFSKGVTTSENEKARPVASMNYIMSPTIC